MDSETKQTPVSLPPAGGVPLGVAGAGAIEFCADGRLRNLTINNNRTPDLRLLAVERSFLALRIEDAGRTTTRILQIDDPALRWHEEAPPRLAPTELVWRGHYPVANYALQVPGLPVRLVWSVFAPIIPFDTDASTLPLVLIGVRVESIVDRPLAVSVLLNWENVNGATALQAADYGPGTCITAAEEQKKIVNYTERQVKRLREEPVEAPPPGPRHNGIELGSIDAPPSNAHGHYCIAAKPLPDIAIDLLAWDFRDAEAEAELWRRFEQRGTLEQPEGVVEAASAAAVCVRFSLAPLAQQRADFVIAWYCPRYVVRGYDQGNGYTVRHKSAIEVAKTGLRNIDYYYASIEGWRGRLKASTLPRWLNDMLVNSCHVFSTNALYTRDGRFGLMESPAETSAGVLHLRMYHALGSALFFPRFEDTEMAQFAGAEDVLQEMRLPARMGAQCLHEPDFLDVDTIQVELVAEFVLSTLRNFLFTGNLARLQALLPRVREAMKLAAARDRDGDGLPELAAPTKTYDGIAVRGLNSFSCGLWLAALRGYEALARHGGAKRDAELCRALFDRARASFERYFWDEQHGYYRLFHEPALSLEEQHPSSRASHAGQLAGQWYADLLGLGPLVDRGRITRALETLERYNERTYGLLNAVMPDGRPVENADGTPNESHLAWPAHTVTHYVALQIYRGNFERGIRVLEKTYRNMLYKQGLRYNQPKKWDLSIDGAAERNNAERYVGALSVWYVLYAIIGLELNIADRELRIMPRLPKGVNTLETLLFTPVCLGWLRYQEENGTPYVQRLHLSLDSPINLSSIELRVPRQVAAVSVRCELPDGAFETDHALEPMEGAQRLIIRARRTVIANMALSIEVVSSTPSPPTP